MPPEAVSAPVLAFDTSAAHCAAALLLPGGLCLARQDAMTTGQAERLMPLLAELLADAGIGWRDLDRIGVGTGPGNFTGIRIAVAAARGLALGLGVPAIGVGRMEALAHGLPRPLLVVEDARRDEVWIGSFVAAGDDAPPSGIPLSGAISGSPVPRSDIGLNVARDSLALCPAAEVGLRFAGRAATGSAARLTGGPVHPQPLSLAEAIARIAAARAPDARPAPIYLRPADAAPPSDPPPVILP